ncbi:MAG: alpha/beta hydrolase [Sulfurovum sp.]|nr:alpha/beta hydrolase [Sulfurovum sp.]
MKSMITITSLVLLFYVGMGVYLYMNQSSLLYFPQSEVSHKYPNITMKNDHESINVIVLNEGHKNAIIYFGGNAESMAKSADYIAGQFPNFTCYLMDYRGYGRSTGEASEDALYSDGLKLYDRIQASHKRISLGGRSLGTGIATYIAAHRKVSKLALITPFDSIVNVAQDRYPIYPARYLLHANAYDSLSRVKDIKAKTAVFMATLDTVVPKKRTQVLIDAFNPTQLEVIIIENRGHNDISSDDKYYRLMQVFIGEG